MRDAACCRLGVLSQQVSAGAVHKKSVVGRTDVYGDFGVRVWMWMQVSVGICVFECVYSGLHQV